MDRPKEISAGTPFDFGVHRFHFGQGIMELTDSSSLLDDFDALHRKMCEDGYLFIHRYRISIDTRYQLACDEKDDRFFFREDGSWLGNFYNKGATYKPMVELRQEWGLE